MNTLPFIEKLHFLESKLGNKYNHSILEPFIFDGSNAIEVQAAGKRIAQHLGLPLFTFIITYAQQSENTAGYINLDDKNEVFIEIDYKYKHDCQIVLSILAHEICHKYLQINDLKLFPVYENEILTDTATIFTGLGKLSLNGCEKISTSKSTSKDKEITTTITTTTTNKVGYMNREQFAFVYRIFCTMKRINEGEMKKGLTPEASAVLRKVSKENSHFLNEHYFDTNFVVKAISDSLKHETGEAQKKFARFNRNIKTIQEVILPSAKNICEDFHSYSKSKIEDLQSAVDKSYSQESQNYMKNLLILAELDLYKVKISEKEQEMRKFGNSFSELIDFLRVNYPKRFLDLNLDFLFEFNCPSCKYKMRIGEKKLAKVKCSKCNYSFIVDTGAEFTATTDNVTRKGLWEKIKSLFQ